MGRKNLSQNFHDITSDGDRPIMTGTEALKYHYSYTFFIRNGTTIMILLMMIQLMERIYWIQMKTVLRRRFQYVSTPSSKRIQWVPVWLVVLLLAKIYFVSFISFCFVLFCFVLFLDLKMTKRISEIWIDSMWYLLKRNSVQFILCR